MPTSRFKKSLGCFLFLISLVAIAGQVVHNGGDPYEAYLYRGRQLAIQIASGYKGEALSGLMRAQDIDWLVVHQNDFVDQLTHSEIKFDPASNQIKCALTQTYDPIENPGLYADIVIK